MEDLLETLLGSFAVAFLIFIAATIGGTLLWALYPHIHALFPTAASSGVITPVLGWWDSVCIVWIFNLILPSAKASVKKG